MSSTQYFDKLNIKSLTINSNKLYLGTGVSGSIPTSSIVLGMTGPFSLSKPGFYVTPIDTNTTSSILFYNPSTFEITYGDSSMGAQGFMGATGPIAGNDTQILFNQSGNVSGDDRLTYNYTHNVLISLGDLSLSSRVPHKFYTYTGTTTTSSSRAEITLTFTNSSFISKVTAILKNSSSAGTSVLLLTDIHDASDNIYISSQSESHTSSLTSYIWDMEQNTSTNTTLTFKTTSETTTFDYQILVETTGNGSLSSISDGTVTQSYTF